MLPINGKEVRGGKGKTFAPISLAHSLSDDSEFIEPDLLVVEVSDVQERVRDSFSVPLRVDIEHVKFILEFIEEDHVGVQEQRCCE